MKSIAVVSTSQFVNEAVERACARYRDDFEATFLRSVEETVEHLNYELPQLTLINCSDDAIAATEVLEAIRHDPWLHSGGLILVFDQDSSGLVPAAVANLNVIATIEYARLEFNIPRLLRILTNNDTILYQRDLHLLLGLNLSGSLVLDNDPFDLTAYANLLANFLFNANLLDSSRRDEFHLALMELLVNAIEHGNCRISFAEKSAHLAAGGDPMELIRRKNEDPEVARRKVHLSYRIRPHESEFVIRDEGNGFDWRSYQLPLGEKGLSVGHGRGIFMAIHFLGSLSYNDAGNEVTFRLDHHHHRGPVAVPGLFADREEQHVADGDVIFTEGEQSSHFHYIVSGQYEVSVRGRRISTLTPADIFVGEMSFLLNNRRSATVRAVGPGVLLRVSKKQFINTVKEKPYYGVFLARLLAQRLVRTHPD